MGRQQIPWGKGCVSSVVLVEMVKQIHTLSEEIAKALPTYSKNTINTTQRMTNAIRRD